MICKRCRLPVVTHKSLTNLNQSQLGFINREDAIDDIQSTVFCGPEDASFIVLSESIAGLNPLYQSPSESQIGKEDSIENLFEYISAKTDLNLPLCQECAESVRTGLKEQYDETCAERDAYFGFLNKIKDDPQPQSSEIESLLQQIKKLEKENENALKELESAEKEQEKAQEELEKAQQDAAATQEEDKELYIARNEAEIEYAQIETERSRLQAISAYQRMQLQRLQRANVWMDVFSIGVDGQIATINGLRLGRLKEKKVEWPEINAAWGQALLLLATVISRLEIPLPEYKLRPLGSMSRIDKIELDDEGRPSSRTQTLELYSRGDTSFPLILGSSKLDAAMAAFLDILRRVGKFVEESEPTLHIPYYIDKEVIGGYSILYSQTSNKEWTQACRHVLTDARWILSYVSTRS